MGRRWNKDKLKGSLKIASVVQYIIENGGHAKIATMPLARQRGWTKLSNLQRCIRNQKSSGTPFVWPKWYVKYIEDYEPLVKLPSDMIPSSMKLENKRKHDQNETNPASHETNTPISGQEDLDQDSDDEYNHSDEGACGGSYERDPRPNQHEANYYSQNERDVNHRFMEARRRQYQGRNSRSRSRSAESEKWNRQDQYYRSRDYTRIDESCTRVSHERYHNYDSEHRADFEPPHNPYMASTSREFQEPSYRSRSNLRSEDLYAGERYRNYASDHGYSDEDNHYLDSEPLATRQSGEGLQMRTFRESTPPRFHPYTSSTVRRSRSPTELRSDSVPENYRELVRYILQNGGHDAIETMPINLRDGSMLIELQRGLREQRDSNQPQLYYPEWYVRFLSEHRPELKPPIPNERWVKRASWALIRYIAQMGGHCQLKFMPRKASVKDLQMLIHLQMNVKKQKTNVQYPPWYVQYLSEYEPAVELPGDMASSLEPGINYIETPFLPITSSDDPLVEYILQKGGHSKILNMKIDRLINGWELLEILQFLHSDPIDRKIMLSRSRDPNQWPRWYRDYIINLEQKVKSPISMTSASQEDIKCKVESDDEGHDLDLKGSYESAPYRNRHEDHFGDVDEHKPVVESARNRYMESGSWEDQGRNSRPRSSFAESEKWNDQNDRPRNSYSRREESSASGSYSHRYQNRDSEEDQYLDSPTEIHRDTPRTRTVGESRHLGFKTHEFQAKSYGTPPHIASTSRQHRSQNYPSRYDDRRVETYYDQKPDVDSPNSSYMESTSWQQPPNKMDLDSNVKGEDDHALGSPTFTFNNQPLFDYILKKGGHAAIESMPVKNGFLGSKIGKLQNSIRAQKKRGLTVFHYPKWYRTFLSLHAPDVPLAVPGTGKIDKQQRMILKRSKVSQHLINYIMKNGGHFKIRNMRVNHKVQNSEMLIKLQKNLFTTGQYPAWYREYISLYEPDVKLPDLPDNIKLPPDASYIERPQRSVKSSDHPLVQYILQNGGHSAIRELTVSEEVEGWRQFKNLKSDMKKQGASFRNYPPWYRKFILDLPKQE